MDGGRDREDVIVGAVIDGAGQGGVGAEELEVADGEGRALDVVRVAVAAIKDGGVNGLCRLVDIRAFE